MPVSQLGKMQDHLLKDHDYTWERGNKRKMKKE
jgi:hypothetical protein